ncbi:MAG: bifunctional phosphopantothenoylcysteine decarboxylase/phosphopantothenate--cysteine ligase CoaBC [Gammaproteobacteria bacterium]|jgi:phosphopantothenoylcysteine decarboxylase/phosphopantothenate--cysteine ligase
MNFLSGKHIVVGVCGGIAAYKAAELVRLLCGAGAQVRVVMTAAATGFIGARTFQALSGETVRTDWSDDLSGMDHIDLARWADRILVAPATADLLARLAQGRANDLLAAICLASEAPVLVAPAMNQAMWRHPATRANVALLCERGVQLCGPAEGEQACGDVGPGRMLQPADLVQAVSASFAQGLLAGRKVIVTAGPTREPIDPVRYLSNRSSGKMGYAVAAAAREAGADVTLISGPVSLAAPPGVMLVGVESARDMLDAVLERIGDCDIFISAAAVADYRPAQATAHKIKRQASDWALPLQPAPDVLATVAALDPAPFCVGFAAETEQLQHNASRKRISKGIAMIAANEVGPGLGFDSDDNALLLVWEGGQRQLPKDTKYRLAVRLIEQVARCYRTSPQCRDTESHAKHSA